MCKRRQSEVTMVLAIIQKEKQQPTNYKIIGTNYLQQSFEEQNSFVLEENIGTLTLIWLVYETET